MIYNELKQHGTENFPVEFYHIDKPHPKYEMAYHWHSEIELIRILEGSLRVTLDNKEYFVSKGDLIFVNSETVHGASPDECVYECVVFNASYLGVSEDEVKPETRLKEDLKADSATVMMLVMDIENEFDIEIEDDAIEKVKTVADLVKYIEDKQ